MDEIKENAEVAAEVTAPSEKTEVTVEQQAESTMKIIRMQQQALSDLVVLDLRNFLLALTAPNVNAAKRKEIRESIERALVMGFDYGVDIVKPTLREHGNLGKLECAFAAHMARLKENGMLIIADNMSKQEKELQEMAKGDNEKNKTQDDNKESFVQENNQESFTKDID